MLLESSIWEYGENIVGDCLGRIELSNSYTEICNKRGRAGGRRWAVFYQLGGVPGRTLGGRYSINREGL